METTRPNDNLENQNIVPPTLSFPVMEIPISPEEARKENPKTAEIRMLVTGIGSPVAPQRSLVGDGILILAQTPNWEKTRQAIIKASEADDMMQMLDALFRCAAEYLQLQDLNDVFDYVVSVSSEA